MANIESIMAADMAATAFDLTANECPADSVIHTDKNGVQTTVAAVLQSYNTIETEGPDDGGLGRQALITVNIPTAQLAEVVSGQTLTINGQSYRITDVNRNAALWEITAVGGEMTAKHNEQFRRRWGK